MPSHSTLTTTTALTSCSPPSLADTIHYPPPTSKGGPHPTSSEGGLSSFTLLYSSLFSPPPLNLDFDHLPMPKLHCNSNCWGDLIALTSNCVGNTTVMNVPLRVPHWTSRSHRHTQQQWLKQSTAPFMPHLQGWALRDPTFGLLLVHTATRSSAEPSSMFSITQSNTLHLHAPVLMHPHLDTTTKQK